MNSGNVLLFGGGRWAKIYIKILIELLDKDSKIIIYSPTNFKNVEKWGVENRIINRLTIVSSLGQITESVSATFIVNSLKNHGKAIKWALNRKIPLLVEKPVVHTEIELQELKQKAAESNVPLIPAQVFLFADYLNNFNERIKNKEDLKKIYIIWQDAKAEERYGEFKSYDPSVYLFADCLPHLISICSKWINPTSFNLTKVKISNGGSCVSLSINIGSLTLEFLIQRNFNERKRFVEITTDLKTYSLDFSIEPGMMLIDDQWHTADEFWVGKETPLTKMIRCFLGLSDQKILDERFWLDIPMFTLRIVDEVSILYNLLITKWWVDTLNSENFVINENLEYAANELLSRNILDFKIEGNENLKGFYEHLILNRFNLAAEISKNNDLALIYEIYNSLRN